MIFSEYVSMHNNLNSMILNDHIEVEKVETIEKWFQQLKSNFVQLTSSEKQIIWAEKIREDRMKSHIAKFINTCAFYSTKRYFEIGENVVINDSFFKAGMKALKQYAIQPSAKFFIDSREDVFITLELSSVKEF